MLQDLKFALRSLRKTPMFTLIAIITIALGIGANAAIFSVINAVLLRPLPYSHPERVVAMASLSPDRQRIATSYPDFLDLKRQATLFEEMSAADSVGMILTGNGEPERFLGRWATSGFFRTLGVEPALGQLFDDKEDVVGCERVIVLTHALWQTRFGGKAEIIGSTIVMNSEPWTVIGVLRSDFDFYGTGATGFFVPIGRLLDQSYMFRRDSRPLLWLTGRLRPGVSIDQARAQLRVIGERLAADHPETNKGRSFAMRPLMDAYVGDDRQMLYIMMGAVAFVLLIACANIANLLLVRSAGRRREIALRLTLGATRWRVARQLLTESVMLSLAGGIAGVALARWGLDVLIALDPDAVSRLTETTLDGRVLAFTIVISCLTGIAFGIAPALMISNTGLHEALKSGGRNATGREPRLRQALVISEVALSLVLLLGAGLLLRSLIALTNIDPGFDAKNVLTMRLRLPDAKYREADQTVGFLRQVEDRVKSLTGVERVAFSAGVPLGGRNIGEYVVEDQPDAAGRLAVNRTISATYHETMGIKLIEGRYFAESDRAGAAPVAIVDEAFVKTHFPQGGALGKRLQIKGEDEPWREIVGIVGNVKHAGLDRDGRSEIYSPYMQIPAKWLADATRSMDIIVKTSTAPRGFVTPIRREITAIDLNQPVSNVRTMEEYVTLSFSSYRFSATLLGVFAMIALILSSVGIYGVISYTVTQRIPELGIRRALGAQGRDILKLILGRGLRLTAIGLGLGLVGALALTRLLQGLLFGVSATDPVTFLVVAAALMSIAIFATYLPARRAMRVSPLEALRND